MKTCSACRQSLSEDNFYKRTYKNGKVGLQSKCKRCQCEQRKNDYRPHNNIRLKLKLTQEQVDELIAPGVCQVCGNTEQRLCIDHDHKTGKPRGLLCHKCNTALGLVDDDVQRLVKLTQYLAQSKPLE